jgi:predicted nucleotidyltransferase
MKLSQLLQEKRQDILAIAAKHGAFNVKIFGSVARGEETETSDIDFLVEFVNDPSFFELFEVQYFLEDLFHCKIDLGMEKSLKEHLREPVLKDVINAL